MSSTYRILCLSHDPAIAFGEWNNPNDAITEACQRSGPAAMHSGCHLVVGRYSYPLVEACVPRLVAPEWVDAGWLRLLTLATGGQIKAARVTSQWKREHVHRLRYELDIEEPTP